MTRFSIRVSTRLGGQDRFFHQTTEENGTTATVLEGDFAVVAKHDTNGAVVTTAGNVFGLFAIFAVDETAVLRLNLTAITGLDSVGTEAGLLARLKSLARALVNALFIVVFFIDFLAVYYGYSR